MAIEIAPPVAAIGGGAMLAGGGALAWTGSQQMRSATSFAQFATPSQVVPSLQDLQRTLEVVDDTLVGVQHAMQGARLPAKGIFSRIPFIGGHADDLERAVRLGAAAKELSKVDEGRLVEVARQLNARSSHLVRAAEADVLQLAAAKTQATGAGTKLLIGGVIAAAGALLLAATVFDIRGRDE
jgi:hypothetical protein